MAELILILSGTELSRTPLKGGEVLIGRDDYNDIILDDKKVSRSHAKIRPANGGWVVADCGSTHGTRLPDGSRISERNLSDGEAFLCGGYRLVYVEIDGAPPPSTSRPADRDPATAPPTVFPGMDSGSQSGLRLKALLEISQMLEEETDFQRVLAGIMDKAISVMGAERGVLLLRGPEGIRPKIHVARQEGHDIPLQEAEKISGSIVRKVLDTKKPALVMNAQSAELGTESVILHHIHSAICVPMKSEDIVTGVIYLDHRQRSRAFGQDDLDFFTTFALQAKAAIDSSRAYWEIVESLFAASNDIIVLLSPDGKITRANHAAADTLGGNESALAGRDAASLFAEQDRETVAATLARTLEEAQVINVNLRLSTHDGRLVPINLSGFALRDRRGNVSGACWIARDVSEVRELIDKLKELNEMKSQYVGMVSHEMKGPLAVMHGYATLILDEAGDELKPEHRTYIEKIVRTVDKVVDLISALLDLTQIETGKIPMKVGPVDLGAILRESIDLQTARFPDSGIKVVEKFSDPLPKVTGDPQMLTRVIENFVSNGIKYNSHGGTLTITVETNGDRYLMSFQDDGLGLSKEDQTRLFGRFFRADSTKKIEGTGLGLSIVKAIVDRHGGEILVNSVLGRGSEFTVTLPRTPPE